MMKRTVLIVALIFLTATAIQGGYDDLVPNIRNGVLDWLRSQFGDMEVIADIVITGDVIPCVGKSVPSMLDGVNLDCFDNQTNNFHTKNAYLMNPNVPGQDKKKVIDCMKKAIEDFDKNAKNSDDPNLTNVAKQCMEDNFSRTSHGRRRRRRSPIM